MLLLIVGGQLYAWIENWWTRIGLGVIGLVALLHVVWGTVYRWRFYDFDDESDIILIGERERLLKPSSVSPFSSEQSFNKIDNESSDCYCPHHLWDYTCAHLIKS